MGQLFYWPQCLKNKVCLINGFNLLKSPLHMYKRREESLDVNFTFREHHGHWGKTQEES